MISWYLRPRIKLLAAAVALCISLHAWAVPVAVISDPKLAAAMRLQLQQEAKSGYYASTFILMNDIAGYTTLSELRASALSGKKTIFLVDAMTNRIPMRIPPDVMSYLQLKGVEIYEFHPPTLQNLRKLMSRMHDKMQIFDGDKLIISDRNEADQYWDLVRSPTVSRSVYTQGKAAQDAKAYFEEMIKSPDVSPYPSVKLSPERIAELDRFFDSLSRRKILGNLRADESWKQRIRDAKSVDFYHDPVGMKDKAPGSFEDGLAWIAKAKKSIVIEDPFFEMPQEMKDALLKASKIPGMQITIYANSVEALDFPPMKASWEVNRRFLASIGATIWENPGVLTDNPKITQVTKGAELDPAGTSLRKTLQAMGQPKELSEIHAKNWIIDGEITRSKTDNADERSAHLNTEVGLNIDSPEVAQDMFSDIQADASRLNYRMVAAYGQIFADQIRAKAACYLHWIRPLIRKQL